MMRHTTIERELDEHGSCLLQTVGVSMEPILRHRYTTVVIRKRGESLRCGDVVLFKRTAGNERSAPCEYVLHRIVGVRDDSFLIRGDNCLQTEVCEKEQILGVMTGFFNGGRYTDCSMDRAYTRYIRTLRLRYGWKRFWTFISRLFIWR